MQLQKLFSAETFLTLARTSHIQQFPITFVYTADFGSEVLLDLNVHLLQRD